MSERRAWQALESFEDDSATVCVDIFQRADGSFGIETFRRDPEDQGLWTITGHLSAVRYGTLDAARAAATHAAPWCRLPNPPR